MNTAEHTSPIEDIIDEARNGRMFILVDDEDRENEGDLIIPAQMATPDVINYMALHGRGLICLALSKQQIEKLELPMMQRRNGSEFETAFTVSIEASTGVTTGISAADRARTVAVAINGQSTAKDISTPGHVFPLCAKEGGVLVRAGHTEASVDIARLAGWDASGVICEIMKEDGTMARMPDLIEFAREHNMKIGTIADLIAYRRRHDNLISKVHEEDITSRFGGDFKMCIYQDGITGIEHIALIKGDISTDAPVLVRMHPSNIVTDSLGAQGLSDEGYLEKSLSMINDIGRGVFVLVRPEKLSAIPAVNRGDFYNKNKTLRSYGVGAQILVDLGITQMELITNSDSTVAGLEGYGLSIVKRHKIV